MASQFGTAATFGLTFETGVLTENIGYSYGLEEKSVRSGAGDETGWTGYNEKAEVTFGGYVPTGSPYSTPIAATLNLVTAVPDFFTVTPGAGARCIVKSVNRTFTNDDYSKVDVAATYYPLLA
jgi:hypothetical protein